MIINLHSIRFRILVTVLVLIVFLFALTALLVIHVSLNAVNKLIIQNNLSLTQAVSQNLGTQLRFLKRSIEDLARIPGLYSSDPITQKDTLYNSLLFQPKDFDTLAIYSPQGKVDFLESTKPWFSTLSNISELQEFKDVIENRKSTLTRFIVTPAGKKIIMALTPLIDEADNLIGVLGGSVDLQESYINNVLATITPPIGGQLFIVDTEGIIIFHPNRQQIGQPLPAGTLFSSTGQEINKLTDLLAYDQFSGILSPWSEKSFLISSAPIGKFPFISCILEDYDSALALLKYHRIVLIVLFLLSLIPAAILSFILSHSIAKPIEQLTGEVDALGVETHQRIKHGYKGEIGKLGAAFNQLLDRLNVLISQLKQSEAKYRNLFNNASDGIVVVDYKNWSILDINSRLVEILNVEASKLMGRPLNSLIKDRILMKVIKEVAEKEDMRQIELNLSSLVKRPLLAEVTCTALSYGDKKIVLINIKDITNQSLVYQHISRIEKMESIRILAGGIAHDFNNIMTGIIGYASLMKRKLKPDDVLYKYADTVERSMIKAKELTSQLLEFARGGKARPKEAGLVPLDVKLLLDNLVKVIAETFDKRITISCSCQNNLYVNADWSQLYEVILNLCINARDAMPTGGELTIRAARVLLPRKSHLPRFARQRNYVVIAVSDTGQGIAPELQDRIFEPFFTTKPLGMGTGLGLSVAYGIVKKYNGFIELKSRLGKGTTFYVCLPLAVSEQEEAKRTVGAKLPLTQGKHILVVDDEKSVADVIANLLETDGFKVSSASDAEEALTIARQQGDEIDLALIDLIMPKLNGKQLFDELKSINPRIKILFTSGSDDLREYSHFLRDGRAHFIPKPFGEQDLVHLLNKLLV